MEQKSQSSRQSAACVALTSCDSHAVEVEQQVMCVHLAVLWQQDKPKCY